MEYMRTLLRDNELFRKYITVSSLLPHQKASFRPPLNHSPPSHLTFGPPSPVSGAELLVFV